MFEGRRKHARTAANLVVGIELSGGNAARASVVDVSKSGIAIECDAETAHEILNGAHEGGDEAAEVCLRWLDPLATGRLSTGSVHLEAIRSEPTTHGAYRIAFRKAETGGGSERDSNLLDLTKARTPPELERQFNRIVEQIGFALPDCHSRTILVTSARTGEGVSTVAWWLSASLAMRIPDEILYFNAGLQPSQKGSVRRRGDRSAMVELLRNPERANEIVHPAAVPNLFCVPANAPISEATNEITDSQFKSALETLKKRFAYIVIDARPPATSPLSLVLGRHADGVLLVIEFSKSDRDQVSSTAGLLTSAGGRIIGAVFNRFERA